MKSKHILSLIMSILLTVSILPQASAYTNSAANTSLSTDVIYSGTDLGATYTKEQTTFKVWAPTAEKVILNRFSSGSNSESASLGLGKVDMELDKATGVWSCVVKGDIAGTYYTYSVTVNGKTQETQDVYSYAVGVNGERSMVVDLASTNPKDWENDKHVLCQDQNDAVIWEVHVRDFSISATSGVNSEYKGKYLAFTEGGTTLNGNTEGAYTGIDYLVNQGVKYIHLNPVYDYGSVDETRLYDAQYNWGYDPVNYCVPDGSYSTNPYDGNVRINEFKQMIQALHDRGIGVIMDVVYNHTYSTDSCFQKTVPDYYYRIDKQGNWYNGSGCGNETKSEAPMYRKYMIDSITYWAKEYHIDGFRFDLMGLHDIDTMNQIRSSLDDLYSDGSGKGIIMYGEPWTGGPAGLAFDTQTTKANAAKISERIGFFNDPYRDAVKGSPDGKDPGYVQTGEPKFQNNIKAALGGNMGGTFNNGWTAKAPSQSVLYQSSHDNLTLFDKITASTLSTNYADYNPNAEKMTMIAEALTLTGNGIAFGLAGEEFCRTKLGEHNSYNSPDSINQIDWSRTAQYATSTAYYKGLLEIRNAFSPISDSTGTSAGRYYFCHTQVPEDCIAYTIDNKTDSADSEWKYLAVIANPSESEAEVLLEGYDTMPDNWVIIANDKSAGLTNLGEISNKKAKVPAMSAMILVDKESFDSVKAEAEKTAYITVNHINKTKGETIKSTNNIYHIGDTFRISPDNDLSFFYDYDSCDTDTTGTVTAEGGTINFYYTEAESFRGTVTVNYLSDDGEKLRDPYVLKIAENQYYKQFPVKIEGYYLNTSKLPAKIVGKFGKENIVLNYYYTPLNSDITVHYYNINNWSKVYFYSYTTDGTESLRKWPGTRVTEKDADGYFVKTVEGLSAAKFCFNNGASEQDPAANMPGYEVAGEVWIKNGKTTFNTTVVTTYVDTQGKKLAEDDTQKFTMIDETSTYLTTKLEFDEYSSVIEPDNSLGYCKPGIINVVYVYDKEPSEIISEKVKRVYGDINNDNNITLLDVTTLQKRIADLIKFDETTEKSADVNGDGLVNLEDVVEIQKYIAKLIKQFSVGTYFVAEINLNDTDSDTATETDSLTDTDTTQTSDTSTETSETDTAHSDTETDSSNTDSEKHGNIIKVYFSNNKNWETVKIYIWNSESGEYYIPWSGEEMTLTSKNEYGEDVYYYEIDIDKYDTVIITDGSSQTVDINLNELEEPDGTGFYLTDKNSEGKYNVDTYFHG